MRPTLSALLLFISCAPAPGVAGAALPTATTVETTQASTPPSEPVPLVEGWFVQLTINGGVYVMYTDTDGFLNYFGPYQPGGNRYALRFKGTPDPGDSFRITREVDGTHLFTVLE